MKVTDEMVEAFRAKVIVDDGTRIIVNLPEALEAALAAAPQEPVAWIPLTAWNDLNKQGSHVAVQTLVHRHEPRASDRYVPLYAAPQPAGDSHE